MAAAAVASPGSRLHDPFSRHATHYAPGREASAFLELLAVDRLIDCKAGPSEETALLNELRAVDLEFARADIRHHHNVATAPELQEEKGAFLDLLKTDMEVDTAAGRSSSDDVHYATTRALHDPYTKKEHGAIEEFGGMYASTVDGGERELRDNVVLMHLLAVDESIDDTRRYTELVASDDYALIAELSDVDREVSGAKRRALLVEDLQGLLDVDHLVDGVKKAEASSAAPVGGGKRSIFSAKEKYTAKVASQSR
ncbi:hypothetical protein ACHAXT_010888 [Thalassiosira profunda]